MKQSFTTGALAPEAFISVGKSRLQSSDSKYYLQDKTEFEIELFNPLKEKVSASISINGKEENYNLVLYPGQRIFLERFMDNNHKFKFETYEVENSKEVKEAISNNGKVVIKFFKEDTYVAPIYPSCTTYINNSNIGWKSNEPHNFYSYGTSTGTSLNNIAANFTTNAINFSKGISKSKSEMLSRDFISKSIETGIVEKGNISNQSFSNSNDNFSLWSFKTINLEILPLSAKPENLSVLYCFSCRMKKKKESWKFCPKCGEEFPEI